MMFKSSTSLAVALVLLTALECCRADPYTDLAACLKTAVPSTLLRTDTGFTAAKTIYKNDLNPNPFSVTKVQGVSDIQAILACARTFKVRAVVRNGGHSFEGNSAQTDTIVIDLSLLTTITVSPDKSTAEVLAGAWLGDVYYYLDKAGLGFPGGRCPSVGISGYLLGGGHGAWSRTHGMGCDRVVSFNMVTWQGELITVNATNTHKDLFWASCGGGGGNFGIVVSWVIKPVVPPTQVQFASLEYPSRSSIDAFDYFQRNASAFSSFINPTIKYGNGKNYFRVVMYSLGTQSLKQFIPPTKLDDFSAKNIVYSNMTWINAVVDSGSKMTTPSQLIDRSFWTSSTEGYKEKSIYLYKPLSRDAISKILSHYALYPSATMTLHTYGGAISAVTNTATAFPHRQGVLGLLQLKVTWPITDMTAKASALSWMNQLETIFVQSMNQTYFSYINYLDNGIAANWSQAYYSTNYERLRTVKQQYDANNFFTFATTAIKPTTVSTCQYIPCV